MADHFELERVKSLLEIRADDTTDDAVLTTLGRGANQLFENFVASKQDDPLPVDDTTRNAVAFKTAARFLIRKKDYDGANRWNEEYKSTIEGIRLGIDDKQEKEYTVVDHF